MYISLFALGNDGIEEDEIASLLLDTSCAKVVDNTSGNNI